MDIMLERVLEVIGNKRGAIKALADFLNISGNNISDWKSGKNKSYRQYAPKIAEYYGVSLDWLSGLTDEKEKKEKPATEGDELDDEMIEMLEEVRRNPELKALFSLSTKATPDDIRKTIAIMKMVKGESDEGSHT